MRVAVVNNSGHELEEIQAMLADHSFRMFGFDEAGQIRDEDYDFVILSGGSLVPIVEDQERIASQLRLVRETTLPVLGICYGCQVLAVAFGGTLEDMGTKYMGAERISIAKPDVLFGELGSFDGFKAHRWRIGSLPDELEVLAHSAVSTEVIRHKDRPLYGYQFHPEKHLDETDGAELFRLFIENVVTRRD